MSACERDELSPVKEEKQAYIRGRTIAPLKYASGGDTLPHEPSAPTKIKDLQMRIISQLKVHYC
jgi:hypothetical protein